MEKLKDMKIKHDHTLTDIVKVVVFWLFLIIPILVWMPTALYYGFNEHADNGTQTASANIEYQYKYQSNEVNTINDVQLDNVYYFSDFSNSLTLPCNLEILSCSYFYTENNTIDMFELDGGFNNGNVSIILDSNGYLSINGSQLYRYYYYEIQELVFRVRSNIAEFRTFWLTNFDDELPEYTDFNVIESATATIEYNNDNSIVNAMSSAWQQTWQTPVLSWTGNQNFNFTIQAFTNIFGITEQSYITNYLTYILTMTAIYVIFDIVLGVFKLITHLVNEK